MSADPSAPAGCQADPSLLAHSRAAFSVAKERRRVQWCLEVAAVSLALISAFMPWATLAAGGALLAVGVKVLAKLKASQARALFRQAERARRYDFEERTLNWPVPGRVHADLLLAFPAEVEAMARELATKDDDYFKERGAPSPSRFVWNLAESIFCEEKLTEVMAGARGKQFALALVAFVAALSGLLLVHPGGLFAPATATATVLFGLKGLGSLASLMVALDVYGEFSAFRRGSRESRDLLAALEHALEPPNQDEGLRILIEYNCLLADLPMVPDEVHAANRERLDRLWTLASAAMKSRQGTSV